MLLIDIKFIQVGLWPFKQISKMNTILNNYRELGLCHSQWKYFKCKSLIYYTILLLLCTEILTFYYFYHLMRTFLLSRSQNTISSLCRRRVALNACTDRLHETYSLTLFWYVKLISTIWLPYARNISVNICKCVSLFV